MLRSSTRRAARSIWHPEGGTAMLLRFVIGSLLILHGLIVAGQSAGEFGGREPIANPAWLTWWPTALGQSWLLAALRLEKTAIGRLAGVLWLIAGMALIAAGVGIFGFLVPRDWWRPLAVVGGALSLLMLLL